MYFSILTSDGQGIAIRLSKQVSRVNKQIRKHLSDYNDLMKIGDQSGADVALMFEDVIQEKWLLETFPSQTSTATYVSTSTTRNAIDLYLKIARSSEEIEMTKRDMERVMQHLRKEHECLTREMDKCREIKNVQNSGLLTVLYNKIIKLERELNLNSELFCDVIAVEPFECTYMSMYVNDYKIIPNECANDAAKDNKNQGMDLYEDVIDEADEEESDDIDEELDDYVDQYLTSNII